MSDHFTVTQVPSLGPFEALQSLMRHFDRRPTSPPDSPGMVHAIEVVDRRFPELDYDTKRHLVKTLLKMTDSPARPKFELEVVDAYYGRVLDAEFEDVARPPVRDIGSQEEG